MGVNYQEQYERRQLEPFWPNEIIKMVCAVLFTMAVIMFFAVLPVLLDMAGLHGVIEQEEPANPRVTPPHIRPEWYFLSVYQYLKLMPAGLLGIEGSALGVLSQGAGMAVLLLLPWWYRTDEVRLPAGELRRGLACLLKACLAFAVSGGLIAAAYAKAPEAVAPWLHPAFWWPPLALVSWAGVYRRARRAGFANVGAWMRVLSSALLFMLFQAVTLLVVLGQGLARPLGAAVGYGVGAMLFLAACVWMASILRLRWRGESQAPARRLFLFVVTENVALFLGLMVWARWPHGGWLDESGGLSHEARQLLMMSGVVLIVVFVFYVLLAAERRSIRRILGGRPESAGSRP